MYHREIDIEQSDQLRIRQDCFHDTLPRERLLPEADFDTVEDFSMGGVLFVEDVFKGEIGLAKTIREVLTEHPASIYRTLTLVA